MTDKEQIDAALEKLDELADDFLNIQVDCKDRIVKYSPRSVMNAVEVFQAILGNVAIHRMIEKETDLKSGGDCAELMGEAISKLVLTWTGIDTKTFYK